MLFAKTPRDNTERKSMSKEKVFVTGAFFNEAPESCADWMLGKLAIQPEKFKDWLDTQKTNSKGYVNIVFKMSKSGKPYGELDTWEPSQTGGRQRQAQPRGEVSADAFDDFGDESTPF